MTKKMIKICLAILLAVLISATNTFLYRFPPRFGWKIENRLYLDEYKYSSTVEKDDNYEYQYYNALNKEIRIIVIESKWNSEYEMIIPEHDKIKVKGQKFQSSQCPEGDLIYKLSEYYDYETATLLTNIILNDRRLESYYPLFLIHFIVILLALNLVIFSEEIIIKNIFGKKYEYYEIPIYHILIYKITGIGIILFFMISTIK